MAPDVLKRRCRYCGVEVIGLHEWDCRYRDEEVPVIEIEDYRGILKKLQDEGGSRAT